MISIPKIVGVMSRGLMLCVSLSGTAQAAEKIHPHGCFEMKGGQRDLVQCEEDRRYGIDIVKGDVLDIDTSKYVVQRFYGKEMQLIADASTQVTGTIDLGDTVEARVIDENNKKYVLSIRPLEK